MTNAMKVHVLDCGAMGTDMEQLLGAPPYRASRHDHHKAATWISASLHTVLIEHPEGLLLWDTAVNRNWEQTWAGTGLDDIIPYDEVVEAQYLDSRLRQLGYEANDIDTVIFSHLHMDHAGNAKLFNNGHTRLLCHEEELAGATSFTGANLGGHIKAEYDGLKFDTVRGDTEILPGITLYETPGHTWGQMSLRLDLDHDGPMIFTSAFQRRWRDLPEPDDRTPPLGGRSIRQPRLVGVRRQDTGHCRTRQRHPRVRSRLGSAEVPATVARRLLLLNGHICPSTSTGVRPARHGSNASSR